MCSAKNDFSSINTRAIEFIEHHITRLENEICELRRCQLQQAALGIESEGEYLDGYLLANKTQMDTFRTLHVVGDRLGELAEELEGLLKKSS